MTDRLFGVEYGGGGAAEAEPKKPSLTAIPKTKPKAKPEGDGGLEPEPTG